MVDDRPHAEEILQIVARETGVERARLTPEATIEQLGIASIDLTLAVFELEKHFDIEIPVVAPAAGGAVAGGSEFGSVGDLVRHVLAAVDRQRAA